MGEPGFVVRAEEQLADAAGLLPGLLGIQFIGVAAATGLVLFFTGALITHFRAQVFYNWPSPAGTGC